LKADGPKNSIDPGLFEGGHAGNTEQGSPEASEHPQVGRGAPNQAEPELERIATEQRTPGRTKQVLGAVRIWPSEEGKRQIALWQDDLKKREQERWASRHRSNAEAAKAKPETGKDEEERGEPQDKREPANPSEQPVTKADHETRKAGAQAAKAEHEARITGAEADEAKGLAKLGGKRWLLRILIANAATGIGVAIAGAITKSTEVLVAGVAIISGTSASAIRGLVKSPPSDKNQGPSP